MLFLGTETIMLGPEGMIPRTDGICYIVDRDCSSVENRPFRTFNGGCNNLGDDEEDSDDVRRQKRSWGSNERSVRRRTPVSFSDGS